MVNIQDLNAIFDAKRLSLDMTGRTQQAFASA
jgi:hypothetical protein